MPEEEKVAVRPSEEETAALPGTPEASTVPSTAEMPEPPKRDLDKERDERVIPVAQGVIADIAGLDSAVDIHDRSEFTNLITNVLKRTLKADLNLTTDNPYVFQLVLGAFSAFNQVVVTAKMADIQEQRFAAIAHEMLALLAGANVPMGMNVKPEEQVKALESIKPQLEEIFAREMLTPLEVKYILKGIMQALEVTQQTFSNNVQDAVQRMEAKILRVDSMTDLTMKKLDETLTADIEELLKPTDDEKAFVEELKNTVE